uniref:Transcription factor 7 n=1 Tax=Piliocolobus tephrosceles TaxID=591936 RepID=A0A8C9IZI8_9PRIM
MPQLDSGGGGAGGGDDLGAPDELLAFQDEGEEQDDKIRDSAAGPERDLAELKSSLVNESEGAAGGAGIPGAGAGALGEAEVGAEVSPRRRRLLPRGRRAPPPQLRAALGVSSAQGRPCLGVCPDPRGPTAPHSPPVLPPGSRAGARCAETLPGQTSRAPGGRPEGPGVYQRHVQRDRLLRLQSAHALPTPLGSRAAPPAAAPAGPWLLLPGTLGQSRTFASVTDEHKANQPPHGVPQLSLYEHFNSPHPTPAPADISQKQVHRPLQTPDLSGFYSLTSGSMGQLPHTVSWPSPPLYPLSPSCGYRQHFPAPTAAPGAPYPRFTHPSLMLGSSVPGHPAAIPHPAIVPPSGKQELQSFDRNLKTQAESKAEKEAKKPTIKKPLNAFMLYMKEMRAKVIAECTLKESAAINQILGRRWHALSREEQAKYYELARKERQLHMQLYPGWSARDNYGKKKRRSREKHQESTTAHPVYFTSE